MVLEFIGSVIFFFILALILQIVVNSLKKEKDINIMEYFGMLVLIIGFLFIVSDIYGAYHHKYISFTQMEEKFIIAVIDVIEISLFLGVLVITMLYYKLKARS